MAAAAIASGVGAAVVGLAPTAWGPADIGVAFASGAAAVLLAARTTVARWAWWAAGLIGLAGALGDWRTVAVAATLVAVAAAADACHRGGAGLAAVLGAVLVQVLLHLPDGRTGLNGIAVLAAAGVLARGAATADPVRARRRLKRALGLVAAAVGVMTAGFAAALLLARADLVRGVDRAEAGLDAAREGRGGQSADLLAGAARDLSDAHRRLDAWWARPVLGLPLVGQQARALSTLSEEGARLAASGAAGVRAAGLDDLRVVDGQVDLAQVRSMAEPLRSVRAQLADSLDGLEGAGSPWLLPPLAGGLDRFERTVVAAAGDADTAAQAVAVLPKLLGGDGERRYLIAFGTPAEARELGGFMGAYAVLAARDGDLSLGGSNRVRNLNVFFQGSRFSDPGALPSSYLAMLPQRFWHNMTATPSFPTMAEAVGQLWQPPRAGELDGILYMDPHTLAALLKLTGPIRIEGHQEPLTSRNAAQFLLRDQYTEFPDDDRHEFLVDAAEQVFDELTTGTLPEPNEVADALSPVIAGRRLLAHSYHPAEQALFEQLGIDGGLPDGQGDFLTVRTQNRGLNKIDALLERSIHYEVARDPSGAGITARVTITLRNEAPSSGLPHSVIGNRLGQPDGTNSTTLAIYTPLELVDVTDDGRSIGRAASPEYGRNRFAVLLDLPPHSERTIVFELAGPLDLAHGYHLDLVPQPLATADRMTVTVRLPLFGVVTPIADRPHNRTFTVDLRSLR